MKSALIFKLPDGRQINSFAQRQRLRGRHLDFGGAIVKRSPTKDSNVRNVALHLRRGLRQILLISALF